MPNHPATETENDRQPLVKGSRRLVLFITEEEWELFGDAAEKSGMESNQRVVHYAGKLLADQAKRLKAAHQAEA